MASATIVNVRLHNGSTVTLTRVDGTYKMRFQTAGAWVETPLLPAELGQLSGAFVAVADDEERPGDG